jgi:ATP-dependent DNA ligase
VHEIKFDGYRLQLHISDGKISCFTRRGYDWANRFPTIVAAAARLELDAAIIDGEAVVVTPKGDTDFAALESYVSSQQTTRSKHQVVFYAFDLLYLRSLDLRGAPLIERKRALAELIPDKAKNSPLRYSEHLEADGATVWRNACTMELEGVVSKLRDSPYHSGRSRDWLKTICRHRDTFFSRRGRTQGAEIRWHLSRRAPARNAGLCGQGRARLYRRAGPPSEGSRRAPHHTTAADRRRQVIPKSAMAGAETAGRC